MSEIDLTDRNTIASVAEELYNLSFDLYRILSKKDGNLFFSPFSVEMLLYLVCTEGIGVGEVEVMNHFNLPMDNSLTENFFLQMLKDIQSMDNVKLQMINKMFIDSSFHIKDKFKAKAEMLSVEAAEVDFMRNPEECTEIINKWVEEKTDPIMKDAIPHGILNSRTSLLLVSAMYLTGKWEFPFDAVTTETFYLNRKITRDVEMMEVTRKFRYGVSFRIGAQFLEMPYMGGLFSFLLILPVSKEGMKSTVRKLKNVSLDFIIHKMYRKEVNVFLPRFVLQQTLDLTDTLLKLGIARIFEEGKTDFNGIVDKPSSLVLSNVIQKNYIDVNEKGSENAPAFKSTVGPYRPLTMCNANRPFLFFIIHPGTSFILHMGKFCDPDNLEIVSVNKELPIPYSPKPSKFSCPIN